MFPPIRIKTRPTIFIMKRKTNIEYDPNKARSAVSTKNFLQQIDNVEEEEEIELDTSHETITETKTFDDIVETLEEFEKPEETDEQNLSDIEHILETNDNTEEVANGPNDFLGDSIVSVENIQTTNANKLLPNLKNRKREDFDLREDAENISNIDSAKSDEEVKEVKRKIEEAKVTKGRLRSNLDPRQEGHSIKETVRKIIQEKMQEVKQKREIKDEQKNIELPIKPTKKKEIVATEPPRRIKILKQELKETSVLTDKPVTTKERIKVTKGVVKDEDTVSKQKLIKTRNITQKISKIKEMKSNLEQTTKEEDMTVEQENETIDMMVEKIAKTQDKTETESPIIQEKITQEDDKENIKVPKPVNVRESIRNIINQFKEFERDFIYDDTDLKVSVSDTSDANRIESDVTEKSSKTVDHSAEGEDQLAVKDPRESLKEIIDQFKYFKHELTSEEDDQFDDIAAKYMERPIAETLLQFNEALKSLMQQRRKTSSPEQTINLHTNKDEHISEDSLRTKKTRVTENNRNNRRAKVLKIKSKGKQESVVVNRLKHDLNVIPDADKNTDTAASTEKILINSQRHDDKVLNNISKIDISKKESSEKNTENNRSE